MKTLGPWDGLSAPTGTGGRRGETNPLAGIVVYPDGSESDTLEDRREDFPDEAAQAVDIVAEPTGAATPDEPGEVLAAPPFDPSEHTVAEVQAFLGENPDQAEDVLAREREGKARVTLLTPKEN